MVSPSADAATKAVAAMCGAGKRASAGKMRARTRARCTHACGQDARTHAGKMRARTRARCAHARGQDARTHAGKMRARTQLHPSSLTPTGKLYFQPMCVYVCVRECVIMCEKVCVSV
jgi:hypothetical protein